MLKALWLLALLCLTQAIDAQTKFVKKIGKNKFMDSVQAIQLKEEVEYDLPIITMNENERSELISPILPSLLTANRDVFNSAASFHFSTARFKIRGYDAVWFSTQINGISMNNPDDGNTQWGLWGGLTDATKNTQMSLGLRASEWAFGNLGTNVQIDMRAYKQRVQSKFSYTFSNRSYSHRWMFTWAKGMNKKGWSYSASGSWRFAEEGYSPGSSYKGGSYFLAIDKQLNQNHILSLSFFGASVLNGKQSPVFEESVKLAHSNFYNAYWGYQAGIKRNANMGKSHQPVLLLTHEYRMDNHSFLLTSLGIIAGEKNSTGFDWYNAPDPRPDYYRYLPGYQQDSLLNVSVKSYYENDKTRQQIDWDRLYEVNRNSLETIAHANSIRGSSFVGKRSHYIIEERVAAIKRIEINCVFNTLLISDISFSGGLSFQLQQSHYFKRVADLLGGSFYVDWNQYAESNLPDDVSVIQNDLSHPNRILYKGDSFGYNYLVKSNHAKAWAQIQRSTKRIDFFTAMELSYTNYLREGLVRNGLFPDNSYGVSSIKEFTNYSFKSGITYKINGRKYLFLQTAFLTKSPLFDDVFISPRTRDSQQEISQNENVQTIETGFVSNAPKSKLRVSVYFTEFANAMNVITFYHDAYRSLVNYALSGIEKQHFGIELGWEVKLSTRFSFTAATAIGRFYNNNRQHVTISIDNDAFVTNRSVIYSKNFRVAGTPQEAYHMGLSFQAGSFYGYFSGNYFRQNWMSINPVRRTYEALENIIPGSENRSRILDQTLLPDQWMVDLSVGTSTKLKGVGKSNPHRIQIYVSINNLLNNQHFISSGYEQLRFDSENKNVDKFPPKYFYAMGLNFSVNLSLIL